MSRCIVHPSAILEIAKSQFNMSTKIQKALLRLPTSTPQQGGKSNNTATLPVDTFTPPISAPMVGFPPLAEVIFMLQIVYADVVFAGFEEFEGGVAGGDRGRGKSVSTTVIRPTLSLTSCSRKTRVTFAPLRTYMS
jgi:hypothetical protein